MPRRTLIVSLILVLLAANAFARNNIRRAFFDIYVVAEGTQLDDLPSSKGHCGQCHFDFNGGGPRNAYGVLVEVGLQAGLSEEEAILAVELEDADADGFSNLQEITDVASFTNTPTFPGLAAAYLGQVLNVDPLEVEPYLTPSGSTDLIPPVTVVTSPNGGEVLEPNSTVTVTWTATDENGVASVDIALSDDGGVTSKLLAKGLDNDGTHTLFLPNLPSPTSRFVVTAYDPAGNPGADLSDGNVMVTAWTQGVAPTTLRDFDLPGTQPFEGAVLDDPTTTCISCHGNYDPDVEQWYSWSGSMMGHTMRDPLFIATMVIAEQDAPASGDLCLRCHTPGGWQEGRSLDTSGGLLDPKDQHGVQCDFCHRAVDPIYQPGVSPVADEAVLNELAAPVLGYGNGQFVNDPNPVRRGPYADADADHLFLESDFHRRSDICGTCHDVSNPVFTAGDEPGVYVVQALDEAHPDGDKRDMFPVERTFSEWSVSEYAATGVYAPQFAGDKADGVVGSCQDCHMKDVTGKGADGGPTRTDIGLHDFTGGNHFVPDIILDWFPGQADPAALAAGKARVEAMLQMAATMTIEEEPEYGFPGVEVRVVNETGHKLPSGYPEGRRIWINLKAFDDVGTLIYESGAYDFATGVLNHDDDAKIYRIDPGTSTRLGAALGVPSGKSFHFVLNDTVFYDNRIPPRGFTNEAFETIQSPPVDYEYDDGQYWDDTHYELPHGTASVEATLYYQSTSKEYIEFLRDANTTNTIGQELYDAWVAQGMAPPVTMATASLSLTLTDVEQVPTLRTGLDSATPNPFNPRTKIAYALAADGRATIRVHDQRGRAVRTLLDGAQPRGEHVAVWDGRDDRGRDVSAGVYFAVMKAGGERSTLKMSLLK